MLQPCAVDLLVNIFKSLGGILNISYIKDMVDFLNLQRNLESPILRKFTRGLFKHGKPYLRGILGYILLIVL